MPIPRHDPEVCIYIYIIYAIETCDAADGEKWMKASSTAKVSRGHWNARSLGLHKISTVSCQQLGSLSRPGTDQIIYMPNAFPKSLVCSVPGSPVRWLGHIVWVLTPGYGLSPCLGPRSGTICISLKILFLSLQLHNASLLAQLILFL